MNREFRSLQKLLGGGIKLHTSKIDRVVRILGGI